MTSDDDDVESMWVEEGSADELEMVLDTSRRIGDVIRERRLHLDLTQQQAAAAAGVSPTTWRTIERGSNPTFRDLTLRAVARTLSWPPTAISDMYREDGTGGIDVMKWIHHASPNDRENNPIIERLDALEVAERRTADRLDQVLAELRAMREVR